MAVKPPSDTPGERKDAFLSFHDGQVGKTKPTGASAFLQEPAACVTLRASLNIKREGLPAPGEPEPQPLCALHVLEGFLPRFVVPEIQIPRGGPQEQAAAQRHAPPAADPCQA